MAKPLSYIEISKTNLRNNVRAFRKYLGDKIEIAAVIKGNAYGHGQNEVAKIIEPYVDYLQIDDLAELLLLRKISHKPALVFGYVTKNELPKALKSNGILSIYDIERLRILDKLASKLKKKPAVHIKIDACLGRQGLLIEDLEKFLIAAKKTKNINYTGVYTHFSNVEDTTDDSHALKQIAVFSEAVSLFEKHRFEHLKKHLSATASILLYEKDKLKSDIVRLGIGLYGLWPSTSLEKKFKNKLKLKPVLRWVTHIAQIKTLPKNYTVGYGLAYETKTATKVAVIPQGYSDGYDRGLSNYGEVLIRGKRCPIIGRVAMNMFVVNINHLKKVNTEDEVVLLGAQGKETITAEEIAEKLGTINYEVTTRINPLLPIIVF